MEESSSVAFVPVQISFDACERTPTVFELEKFDWLM
jgi:hypothetical protein